MSASHRTRGGFSGGFGSGAQGRSKGSDMRIRVKLTLEEIASGIEKKIKVPRKVQAPGVKYGSCSNCNGTGQIVKIADTILGRMQTSSTCPSCSGSGKVLLNRPPGSDSNGMIKKEETVSYYQHPHAKSVYHLSFVASGRSAHWSPLWI